MRENLLLQGVNINISFRSVIYLFVLIQSDLPACQEAVAVTSFEVGRNFLQP